MKPTTLDLLCCPACKTELSIQGDGNMWHLLCDACGTSYPIHNGTPSFIASDELEGSNRRFARQYDRLAPFYTLFTKFAFLPFGGERKARLEILQHLDLNGGRVLEISIGNGVNIPYLFAKEKMGKLYGLDISQGQLTQCDKLAAKENRDVELFHGMAEKLPFHDGTFDSILHIGGINFFSDRQRAIEEMIRVAKPGCRIVIADEAEHLAKLLEKPKDGHTQRSIVDLVPAEMEEIQMHGIWRSHGKAHGYCLTFRKPVP